jgi:cell division protein FtsN
LVIGAVIGVLIAIGVALFLNKSTTPFTASTPADAVNNASTPHSSAPEMIQPADNPAVHAIADASTAAASQPKQRTASAPAASTPVDYDFYQVLGGNDKPGAAKPGADKPATDKPATDPKPTTTRKSYLQLGAFQNAEQADNLKAKLALIGVQASIQSRDGGEGKMLHRVRIGPFNTTDELNHMRSQLKQNGIDSAVMN